MSHNNIFDDFKHFICDNQQLLFLDLAALIEIPSVFSVSAHTPFGSECQRALHTALEMGRREGFQVINYDDYCGEIILGDQEESIAMATHLDVVEAGSGWTYPPFQLSQEGDYIVGRGTNDNKAPFVICLYLMKFLRERNIPLKRSIRLICGCDEETGMRDLVY